MNTIQRNPTLLTGSESQCKKYCQMSEEEVARRTAALKAINRQLHKTMDFNKISHHIFLLIASMGNWAEIVSWRKVNRLGRALLSDENIYHYSSLFTNFCRTRLIQKALVTPPLDLGKHCWSSKHPSTTNIYTEGGSWLGWFNGKESSFFSCMSESPILNVTSFCPTPKGALLIKSADGSIVHFTADSLPASSWKMISQDERDLALIHRAQDILSINQGSAFLTLSPEVGNLDLIVAYWQFSENHTYSKIAEMRVEKVESNRARFFKLGDHVFLRCLVGNLKNKADIYLIQAERTSLRAHLFKDEMLGDPSVRTIVNGILASPFLTHNSFQFIGSFYGSDKTWNIGCIEFSQIASNPKLKYTVSYQLPLLECQVDSIEEVTIVASESIVCVHYSVDDCYTTQVLNAKTLELKHILNNRGDFISCFRDIVVTECYEPQRVLEIYDLKTMTPLKYYPIYFSTKGYIKAAHLFLSNYDDPRKSNVELTYIMKAGGSKESFSSHLSFSPASPSVTTPSTETMIGGTSAIETLSFSSSSDAVKINA